MQFLPLRYSKCKTANSNSYNNDPASTIPNIHCTQRLDNYDIYCILFIFQSFSCSSQISQRHKACRIRHRISGRYLSIPCVWSNRSDTVSLVKCGRVCGTTQLLSPSKRSNQVCDAMTRVEMKEFDGVGLYLISIDQTWYFIVRTSFLYSEVGLLHPVSHILSLYTFSALWSLINSYNNVGL